MVYAFFKVPHLFIQKTFKEFLLFAMPVPGPRDVDLELA